MNNNSFDKKYDSEYINNIFINLPTSNVLTPEESKKQTYLGKSLWSLTSAIYTGLSGSKNELKAHQLIIDYINNPQCNLSLKPFHQKIVEIYERLAHLSMGNGKTWADGIDRELLVPKAEEQSTQEEEVLFKELEEMVVKNIFLPPTLEEEIFEKQEASQPTCPDSGGASYSFTRIKNLTPLDHKHLFHIHADEFGSSSTLEGGQAKDAINYLRLYLTRANEIKNDPSFAALIEELANAAIVPPHPSYYNLSEKPLPHEKYAQVLQSKIKAAFQSKKPLLLAGGWTKNPSGHAIYYEVIPESDRTATFRIYNTGAGVKAHPHVKEGHKIKFQAYCEWKGIDRERLESAYFAEALYELDSYPTLPYSKVSTAYGEKDVYQGLRNFLHVKDEQAGGVFEIDKDLLMSPQHAGVCSWRSLMAFTRTKIGLNDYKRFKCDLKLQTLIDYVENPTKRVSPEDWRLVKKSHQKLCRSIVRLHQKKLIGDTYLLDAQKALKPVSQWIHDHSDCRYQRKVSEIPSFNYQLCAPETPIGNKYSLDLPLNELKNSEQAEAVAVQPYVRIIEDFKEIESADATQIEEAFMLAIDLSQAAWIKHEDLTLYKGIIDFVSKLELGEEFWKKAVAKNPKKTETLISQLGQLANFFTKSCFTIPEAHVIFPEKIYVFHKILHLQEQIYRLGHPLSQKNKICLNSTKFDKELFLTFSDTKMQREMNILRDLYREGPVNVGIHLNQALSVEDSWVTTSYLKVSENHVSFKLEFCKGDRKPKQVSFVEFIRQKFPKVIDAIAKDDPSFKNLPQFSQDARIYGSPLLPDWIKAMRDTFLSCNYIEKCSVGPLAALDRTADIEFQFSVQDRAKKVSEVKMELRGVTGDLSNLPAVQKVQKNSYLRYANRYPEITSTSIQKLIVFIRNKNTNEKELMNTLAKKENIEMPDEEFKELARLFTAEDFQCIETLEYFTKYPKKLKEPDYQTLFHLLLFKIGELDKNLAIPGFADRLSLFIQKNYEQLIENNEIQAAVFLMKVAYDLVEFCPQQDFFYTTTSKLHKLVDREGIDIDEKCLIYAELVAQLSHKKIRIQEGVTPPEKVLTEEAKEEIASLIEGTIYLHENQFHSKYAEDPDTAQKVREALLMHSAQIQEALEQGSPNQNLLNRILQAVRTNVQEDKEWTMVKKPGEFPVFSTTDGKHTLYPMLSMLISSESQTLLPTAIRQNPLFAQLFPGIVQGTYSSGNVFAFKDRHGKDTLVHLKGDFLIIEQKLEDHQWYRYVPAACFISEEIGSGLQSQIGSRYLVHHYTHWQSLEKNADNSAKIYVLDPKTGEKQYLLKGKSISSVEVQQESEARVAAYIEKLKQKYTDSKGYFDEMLFKHYIEDLKKNGEFQEEKKIDLDSSYFKIDTVTSLKDSLKLGEPSALFTNFEDQAYIHEWYDNENRLSKIELPRFNLSFKPDPKDPKNLICDQFPTYVLNVTAPVKALGSHHHYILLENAKGQKKVLLPQQRFETPREKEVLAPRYSMYRELEREKTGPQKYLAFDLGKKDLPFIKSREANLYLSQVLATAQEYKKAVYYLQNYGEKLSAYTQVEAQILRDISNIGAVTGDQSGNGVALQLYADYLLIKNTLSHHQAVEKKDLEQLRSHYSLYLTHYSSANVLKLKPAEEVYLLKMLLKQSFDSSHFLRLKELDPAAARRLQLPTKIESETLPNQPRSLYNFELPDPYKHDFLARHYSEKETLLTRPHENLKIYCIFFYDTARTGTEEEKQQIKNSLYFLRASGQTQDMGMANFFEAVLENPEAFPPPIKESSDYNTRQKETAAWKEQLRRATEDQFAKMPPVSSYQEGIEIDQGDLNQIRFRLDQKQPTPPVVKLAYNLPVITSFADSCKELNCFHSTGTQSKKDIQALSQLLQMGNQKDPVQKREADRLVADLKAYQQQPVPPSYTAQANDIISIFNILAKDKLDDKEQLERLEKEILTLANKNPSNAAALAELQLKKWGKTHKVLTLEELLVYFARQDAGLLLQRNPLLEETEVNLLMGMLGSYLLYATRDQQRTRAEAILSKLGDIDTPEYNDLVNQLAQEMLSRRAYNPVKNPAYLVFEYFANLSMRETQVNKLERFLSGKDVNAVMEMIMGSGKSKVLLPLLGLLRANGEALSMLIVPQPLFESVSQDTQAILQEAFSQSLRSLLFDRHTRFTQESLQTILDDLQNIRRNRECLIMTSKSVQCLLLKFIEETAAHFQSADQHTEWPEKLKTMQKILNILRTSGCPMIDEADSVLNVLHEVSFSSGKRVSPPSHEISLLSELYSLLYENPLIKRLARLESDPAADTTAPLLTEQVYYETVQQPLAEFMIARLGEIHFESKALKKKTRSFIRNLDTTNHTHLMHYLCRDEAHLASAQKFYDSLDPEIQDVVAFVGEQISHLLPYTLTRICEEKYGLDKESGHPLAIPFSAANTPSTGSQFANAHITMNYTFQTYMKKGISREIIEGQIKLLQEKAMLEMAISGGKMSPLETAAGKAFVQLRAKVDIPLFKYDPRQLDKLCKKINQNAADKRSFVSQLLLPQMESFEKKMSCNPQNLVALFNIIMGFTGTLWNGLSMHHTLKPEPEVGTDAKTLSILWENSRSNAVSIQEGSTQEMLRYLRDQGISYDMISDAGGYFKEGSNADIAREIAAVQGKGTVFYNTKGEQTLLDGSKEVALNQSNKTPEERLTFLDQAHTTGADVPQKRDAISLVTIGRNMLLRDLLQSVWRLRGLEKSQQVRFLVGDEVAGIIRQKLGLKADASIQLPEILQFVIANQAEQQGRDNYKALKQELANLSQQVLLGVLLNETLAPQVRFQAFHYLKTTWIKPASFSSRELYGTLATDMPSKIVLDSDKRQSIEQIQEMFTKMPWLETIGISQKECLEKIEFLANRIKDSLSVNLQTPSRALDNDQTVEVERETETETERETELEVQEATQTENIVIGLIEASEIQRYASFVEAAKILQTNSSGSMYSTLFKPSAFNKLPAFSLKSYLETDKDLSAYASAFEGIDITLNVLEWTSARDTFALLGSRRTDFHHLLVQGSTVLLMSQHEARSQFKNPDYYNLTLGYTDLDKKPPLEVKFKVVKLKFLNGESQFSFEEIELLKKWFRSQGAAKMQKLYQEHILQGYPQKAARYQDSPLQKLFAEMKNR